MHPRITDFRQVTFTLAKSKDFYAVGVKKIKAKRLVKPIKQRLMIIMGYLGAVIGAGFASGQEIVQFFVGYGEPGFTGTMLAAVLFAVSGGMLLYTAHKQKMSNYQDILAYLLGNNLGRVVDFLLAIFLFLGISTMLSASGAVFYEHLYLPKYLGIMLAYVMVVIALAAGKRGLIYSYSLLVPVKIILLLLIAGYVALFVSDVQVTAGAAWLHPQGQTAWPVSSILYVAYNFSLAMVVLSEYQSISSQRDGIIGAVEGGLLLGLLVVVSYCALSKFLPTVLHYQVPMLYVAGHISPSAKLVYTIVLWMGILTTAIANAYGFAQRFSHFTGLSYGFCLILCMTLALPVSTQSFSGLVNRIYPAFGVLGVLILSALIYKSIKKLIKGNSV